MLDELRAAEFDRSQKQVRPSERPRLSFRPVFIFRPKNLLCLRQCTKKKYFQVTGAALGRLEHEVRVRYFVCGIQFIEEKVKSFAHKMCACFLSID